MTSLHSPAQLSEAYAEETSRTVGPNVDGEQRAQGSNSATNQSQQSSPRSSLGSSGIDWASCGSFVVWALETWWDWTFACLEIWWHVLVASNLEEKGLYRLSNLMLGWHYLGVWIAHAWLAEQKDGVVEDIHTIILKIQKPNQDEDSNAFLNDATWWLWALPLVTGFLTALVAVPYLIQVPYALHQGTIVMTLVLLFFLEALLPIMLLVCTFLCMFHQLSWVVGVLVLAFIWMVISLSTHWIRCIVYQNMGHR